MNYGFEYGAPVQQTAAAESGDSMMGFLLIAVVALIIAFAVVSSMKAKLKTARSQQGAERYTQKNSLNLLVRQDHFLYVSEQRRRIQQQPQNRQPMQKGR